MRIRDWSSDVCSSDLIGAATEGGAFAQQYSAVGGPSWNGGSFMLAGDFSRTGEIKGRQRPYTSNLLPDSTVVPGQKQLSIVIAGRPDISNPSVIGIEDRQSDVVGTRELVRVNTGGRRTKKKK